jgi:hypothetical protein
MSGHLPNNGEQPYYPINIPRITEDYTPSPSPTFPTKIYVSHTTCQLCGTEYKEVYCPKCSSVHPTLKSKKTTTHKHKGDTMSSEFFIQKALEGYDARFALIEKKFKELEEFCAKTLFAGLQSVQFQAEGAIRILVNKGIATEEELDALFKDMYAEIEALHKARASKEELPLPEQPS